MNSRLYRRQLGLEIPLFAFSNCGDVVAAASHAGGLAVLLAGQAVGLMDETISVVQDCKTDYLDAVKRLDTLMEA